jgi:hypothetical protein
VHHGEKLPIPKPPENIFLETAGDENDEHQLHLHSEEQQPSA